MSETFLKGESVYIPLNPGITAPGGFVWKDKGDTLVLCKMDKMPPREGYGQFDSMGFYTIDKSKVKRNRWGLK